MHIHCLGCAGGYPMGDNGTTAFVVSSQDRSYHILLDAGSGAARALENYLDVLELNAVIISHDHADHVADLGTIQHLLMLKPSGAKHAPVPIYLHDQSAFPPLAIEDKTSQLMTYGADSVLECGPFRVSFCQTVHPLPCYAMRLEELETGQVLVFTADTGWCPELIEFSQGAHVLIADSAFTNERGRNEIHMTASEVAQLANQAHVRTLVASHMAPHADQTLILQQIAADLNPDINLIHCQPGLTLSL